MDDKHDTRPGLIDGASFDLTGPDWARDPHRPYYTVAHLDASHGSPVWLWNHALFTYAYVIAEQWAIALLAISDMSAEGVEEDAMPTGLLARIDAHRDDPVEEAQSRSANWEGTVDEDNERIIAFVTVDGIVRADDPEGQRLIEVSDPWDGIYRMAGPLNNA